MSATDALLFIDANKYLDLYRTDKGQKLLAPLAEQVSYIFVTQQVVDEVQRNKLGTAAEFLRTKSQGMKLQGINVLDHLSGSVTGKKQEILNQMKEISKSVSAVNDEIDALTLAILAQVAVSEDEVSKALVPIFAKAVAATPDELRRARERKEVGNPPGKRNDPLGDEITWEQILSHFEGKRRLWIISRDGDYSTMFRGTMFLNGFLRSELIKITEDVSVHIFQDLVKGLTHFVETTKVEAKEKLTPEEVIEIEAEEWSLPPVYSSRQAIAAMQPSAEIQKIMEILHAQPSAEIQKIMEILHAQPSAEIQRAIAAMQPSAEIQKIMEILHAQPSAEIQRAIAAMQPSAGVPKDEDE